MTQDTIALVTGANKGIGYEVARLLGEAGTVVLVGARSPERGAEAVARLTGLGVEARHLQLDVTDQADIDAAAKWIEITYGRLDVLVNNAGIAHPADHAGPSATPVPVLREMFETNVFGVVAVTNAMLPLLRKSQAGRIVNVSSELGSFAETTDPAGPWYPFNMLAYNAGKSALNAVTVAYAKELADTAIKVNAGNPGHCATDMNGNTGFRSPAEGAVEIVRLATLDADGPTGGFFRDGAPMPW
ncbi:SDR family NAD(P)-dependent oxidoreductase [Herbidospora sp. NEAU-GS84]|uniref:SDR family NAD(P)-dependent oxidoreductase n=1 Tax=Herbidospora solisilvae TaxID=2696284 RepID=A0A7C9JF21_9ACTN|nr:SDR family oxidoreductase [Herbidospora solisilvae]NAS25704.1 SDR family NAD(P)-dependent oxidoreductase [Herbidospora solisilvae]